MCSVKVFDPYLVDISYPTVCIGDRGNLNAYVNAWTDVHPFFVNYEWGPFSRPPMPLYTDAYVHAGTYFT